MMRRVAAGLAMVALAFTARGADKIDVWVQLSEPPLASNASDRQAIQKQQEAVRARLQALGAVELGGVSRALNALAVSIDPGKLPDVKRIPGVRSVAPVQHIERDPPTPPVR